MKYPPVRKKTTKMAKVRGREFFLSANCQVYFVAKGEETAQFCVTVRQMHGMSSMLARASRIRELA
jgi:hypothetical protein